MLADFIPFLPLVDECGDRILEPEKEEETDVYDYANHIEPVAGVRMHADNVSAASAKSAQKSEKEILDEMQRLGM